MKIDLAEIGKTISAASASKIKAAIEALQALLSGPDAAEATEALRQLQEAEMSFDDTKQALRGALKALNPDGKRWYYIRDAYPDSFVYEDEGPEGTGTSKLYQRSYAIVDGKVTLGDPVEVRQVTTYEPVKTSATEGAGDPTPAESDLAETEITGDVIPLVEAKAVGKDGITKVRIISPGIGSSGYYSPEVLKAAAPKFADAQCFWDHPTSAEETGRPERSLRDLAGKVVSTPVWQEQGATGPGIYADVQVFKPYQEAVQELAPHIGMSIRATGRAKTGKVEGRKVPVIEGIEKVRSVDFVTVAGRGGEVLQLFEAARGGQAINKGEVSQVDEQEAKALREAKGSLEAENAGLKAEVARHREAALLVEARTFATETLAKIDLPDLTRARLLEALAAKPVVKDGALDRDAFKATIEETAKAELEYVAKLTGKGQITGMGNGAPGGTTAGALKESFVRVYRAQGKSEAEAEALAKIAAGS